jgi:hypothetical protein
VRRAAVATRALAARVNLWTVRPTTTFAAALSPARPRISAGFPACGLRGNLRLQDSRRGDMTPSARTRRNFVQVAPRYTTIPSTEWAVPKILRE